MVSSRRAWRVTAVGACVTAVATSGCKPNLDDTVSIVTSPEIVAVRSDPAEAPPTALSRIRRSTSGPRGP